MDMMKIAVVYDAMTANDSGSVVDVGVAMTS
jgi:hypothetical protein